jgi:hypothetical protein
LQQVSLGPTEKLAGREVIPLTISWNGRPHTTSYCDAATHLVVKDVKHRGMDVSNIPDSLKKVAAIETSYSDFKDFEGAVLATRITASQNGKQIFTAALVDVEFHKSFEPRLFEKPPDETR